MSDHLLVNPSSPLKWPVPSKARAVLFYAAGRTGTPVSPSNGADGIPKWTKIVDGVTGVLARPAMRVIVIVDAPKI